MEGYPTICEWYKDLEERILTNSPTRIANIVIQLGIDHKGHCDCGENNADWPTTDWLHKNHGSHNLEIHKRIMAVPGLMQKIRKVLLHDIKISAPVEKWNGEVWGRITRPEHSKWMLDNFLQKTLPEHMTINEP